jgi:hypothetical protein
MPIQAVRITMKGQQAVHHLTRDEAPPRQKRPVLEDPAADKLSLRKALILVATADGKWYTTRQLQRRVAETGEFPEWTAAVSAAKFAEKGLGSKLVNELIDLSDLGYLQLGREEPRRCSKCGQTAPVLIVTAVMANETWDGSEARITKQTPPLCRECFVGVVP